MTDPSRSPHWSSPGEHPLPNELRALEAALASLVPRSDRLDQERLWFEAGRRAAMAAIPAHRNRWALTGASAVSAALAVAATLLVMLWSRPETQIVERIRVLEVPVAQAVVIQQSADAVGPPAPAPANGDSIRRGEAEGNWGSSTHEVSVGFSGSRAAQLERMSLLLRHGADLWQPLAGATTEVGARSSSEVNDPPTYYEQRRDLLGEQVSRS